jgi:para-aminobenzoate synthetase/4-amino-4-deoxychorismate lyase
MMRAVTTGAPSRTPAVGTVRLESGRSDVDGARDLRFEAPIRTVRIEPGDDPRAALEALQRELDGGRWLAGYLAYEAGYPLLGLPLPAWAGGPLGWFGVYDGPVAHGPEGRDREDPSLDAGAVDSGARGFAFTPSRVRWRDQVADVHERIRAGASYQLNLTGRMRFRAEAGGWTAYRAWSRSHPVPFGAYLRPAADHEIVSLSPELFVRSDGRRVWTRPMKGTAPRGRDPDEDDRLAARLQLDPKTRAENVMIVDLLRNDLGRVAAFGSVRVDPLFAVERYASLLQLTSTVHAELRPELRGRGWAATVAALFPCGSVTGAPKRATVEAIAEIEGVPRGAYTGAIGYAAPDGSFAMSVAIRTAEVRGRQGVLGLGGGVLIDSDADAEYDEALLKGAFARSA